MSPFALVRKSFRRGRQRIELVDGADSQSPETLAHVGAMLGGRPVDFLFLDGDHRYEAVRRDFELYAPLVRPGGLVAFHDVSPSTTADTVGTAAFGGGAPGGKRDGRMHSRGCRRLRDRRLPQAAVSGVDDEAEPPRQPGRAPPEHRFAPCAHASNPLRRSDEPGLDGRHRVHTARDLAPKESLLPPPRRYLPQEARIARAFERAAAVVIHRAVEVERSPQAVEARESGA